MRAMLFALLLSTPALAAWQGTWHMSPQQAGEDSPWELENVTLRNYLSISKGGQQLRLRFSNLYGKETLHLGKVTVGVRDAKNPGHCSGLQTIHFSGGASASLPAGTEVMSDELSFSLEDRAELCVSYFLPGKTKMRTVHGISLTTDHLLTGNQASIETLPPGAPSVESRFFLTGVDTEGGNGPVIGFLGDSITDGAGSAMNQNHRWTDFLEDRLTAAGVHASILNAGIGGNRLLRNSPGDLPPFALGENALARFDRELLSRSGLTHAVVLIGINDIGHPGHRAPLEETVTAADLIAGYKKLIEKAHARGVKILGGTLPPFKGNSFPGYYSEEKEKVRQAVNEWIRTSHAFDGVLDFDFALRDPKAPLNLLAKYDSGDHLHPGDEGYRAMAAAVNLKLFTRPEKAPEAEITVPGSGHTAE